MNAGSLPPITSPRKKQRMGTGPTPFRMAMMACGLKPKEASHYLGVDLEVIQKWMRMRDATGWQFGALQMLKKKIDCGNLGPSDPKGAHQMCALLHAWKRT